LRGRDLRWGYGCTGATLADLPADRLGGAASLSSSSVRRQQGHACLVSRAETGTQNEAHCSSLLSCSGAAV
ncbi:unnamed protein product, partial [Closterium sp. NIES-53]